MLTLKNPFTGLPVNVDLTNEPYKQGLIHTKNKFIVSSPDIDSYLAEQYLTDAYKKGAIILLMDQQGSYRNLCSKLGGTRILLTPETCRFNPFYANGTYSDTRIFISLYWLLKGIWLLEDDLLPDTHFFKLNNLLSAYFDGIEKNDVFPCFNSFYDFVATEQACSPKLEFDFPGFLSAFKKYYHGGEFEGLMNATKVLSPVDTTFVYFELPYPMSNPLQDKRSLMYLQLIFNDYTSRVRANGLTRKVIFTDFAWKSLAGTKIIPEALISLLKSVRAYNGEVVISSKVEKIDYSNESVGYLRSFVLNNCDTRILIGSAGSDQWQDSMKYLFSKSASQDCYYKQLEDELTKLSCQIEEKTASEQVFISFGGSKPQAYVF